MERVEEPLYTRYFRIFIVVSLYWVISISLVFVNKSLLSGSDTLDAPLFVTLYQCIVTFMGCYLALYYFHPEDKSRLYLSWGKAEKVFPLTFVFVGMITFNNLCLRNVGISFYYVGRSLTTVFNVVFSWILLSQKTSVRALFCCFLIIFGFFLGVDQEKTLGTLSFSGTIFGVLASLFVCLNSIYTKKVLPEVDGNIWELQMYNNFNACLLFVPLLIIFGETNAIVSFPRIVDSRFWLDMTIGGLLGFAIGYVTGLQIKVTSPLTHNISGTAKSAAQTILATQYHAEIKTVWWWGSNALVLAGSALYAHVRRGEMESKSKENVPKV